MLIWVTEATRFSSSDRACGLRVYWLVAGSNPAALELCVRCTLPVHLTLPIEVATYIYAQPNRDSKKHLGEESDTSLSQRR